MGRNRKKVLSSWTSGWSDHRPSEELEFDGMWINPGVFPCWLKKTATGHFSLIDWIWIHLEVFLNAFTCIFYEIGYLIHSRCVHGLNVHRKRLPIQILGRFVVGALSVNMHVSNLCYPDIRHINTIFKKSTASKACCFTKAHSACNILPSISKSEIRVKLSVGCKARNTAY